MRYVDVASCRLKTFKVLGGALFAVLVARASTPQTCEPQWSPEFSNATTGRRFVSLDLGSGPELYVYGVADTWGGSNGYTTSSGIAKWNGRQWSEVAPGLMPTVGGNGVDVLALAAIDDGSGVALWAAGRFSTLGFGGEFCVAKWDGSIWSALPEPLPATTVCDIAYAEGSVVVAGLLHLQGSSQQLAARWNGSSWVVMPAEGGHTFSPFAAWDLHIHDGELFLAADDGVAVRHWTGSAWVPVGGSLYDRGHCLTSYQGELHVGGTFLSSSQPVVGVMRWSGSSWIAVGDDWLGGGGNQPIVSSLAVHDDGNGSRLYASGAFSIAAGVSASHIASFDGSSWAALGNGVDGVPSSLAAINIGSNRGLYLGYGLGQADDLTVNGTARWADGHWSTIGLGATWGSVSAIAAIDFKDGKGENLYAGGNFPTCFGTAQGNVVRWDGVHGTSVGGGVNNGALVLAIAGAPNGIGFRHKVRRSSGGPAIATPLLFVGGDNITQAGSVAVNNVAAWDGSQWLALEPSSGPVLATGPIRALKVVGGRLLVGCDSGYIGGVNCNGVARWDGQSWEPFGEGLSPSNRVYAFAEHDDGSGLFAATEYGVYERAGATWAKLEGGNAPNPFPGDPMRALAFDDGNGSALFAAQQSGQVYAWHSGAWTLVGDAFQGSGMIGAYLTSLSIFDDGSGVKLYVGGGFESQSGLPMSYIASWNGAEWSSVGPYTHEDLARIECMVPTRLPGRTAASLFVGGNFKKLGDVFSASIGEWIGCP